MVESLREQFEKRKKEESRFLQEEKEILELEKPDSVENDKFYKPDSDSDWDVLYKKRLDQQRENVKKLYPDDIEKQQNELKEYRKRADIELQYSKQFVGGIFDSIESLADVTVNRWLPEDYKINLPDIDPPENIKQGLVRGGSQFMVPFLGWYGALSKGYKFLKGGKKAADTFKKSWAADFGLASAAGAITDVVHFKAEDPTLSNLVEQYPHLKNPITNFLQTDPDDPEALNRFKRAVEGFGLGSVFPIIFRGVGKGFSYTREKATERIVKSAVEATDLNFTPKISKETGKPIKGHYHARVDGNEIFIDRNSATKKWDVTVNNERAWSYDRLSDARKGVANLLNHKTNIDEGLRGKHKKLVDTNEPLFNYMSPGVEAKTWKQRVNDFSRNKRILDYFLMKLFDQHHGIKLLGREVFSGKLTAKGLKQLVEDGVYDPLKGYKEMRVHKGATGLMEILLGATQARWSGGQFKSLGKKGLKDILSPVNKEIRTFMQYWAALRLMNIKKQVTPAKFVKVPGKPDKFVPGVYKIDDEKIKRLLSGDAELKLAFEEAAGMGTRRAKNGKLWSEILEEVDEFNDSILMIAKDAQIIDAIQLDKLRASPHFIPFYRDFVDVDGNSARIFGKGGLRNVLQKEFKGAPIGKSGAQEKVTNFKQPVDKNGNVIEGAPSKKSINTQGVQNYPLKDLVEGYLGNVFNIIKNAERNRTMLIQLESIEELIRQSKASIATGLKAEKVEKLGRELTKKETAKIDKIARKQAEEKIGQNWARKVPMKMKKIKADLDSSNVKGQLKDMGMDISDVDALKGDLTLFSPERIQNQLEPNQFLVTKIINGKRKLEIWEVPDNNPFLFNSFLALYDRQAKYTHWVMRLSGKFKNVLTRGVTYDPGFFMWANFIRDTASAAILSKNTFNIPVMSSAAGLYRQWRKNPIVKNRDGTIPKKLDGTPMRYRDMWHEFVMNGGSFGSTLLRSNINENALKRLYQELGLKYTRVYNKQSQFLETGVKKPGRGARKVVHGYDDFVSTFEYATRFQEYLQLRRRGVGAREAAYQAREIATDFGMHGASNVIKIFTQTVPFLNAGLQGLYRSARAFEGLTKGERQFVGAKIATALTVPTLYFRYLNRDNKDYENLPDHVKEMNWTVPLPPSMWGKPDAPEERFFYIPKPFEWGAAATVIDRAWDWLGPQDVTIDGKTIPWLSGKGNFTWDDFISIASKVVSEQLRLDIVPQVISPWADLAINKRFTGSAIVPKWMKDTQDKTHQYYPWSNAAIVKVWKKYNLGTWTPLSPIQFEYLLKGYTGAMGQYFLDFLVDPPFRGSAEEGEKTMWTAPRVTGDPFGIPGGEISPWIFQDWNKVPLLKRMFSVGPQRHTQNILDAYKLKNELDMRMATLNKYKPELSSGKPNPEYNSDEWQKYKDDPYYKSISILNEALGSHFEKMSEISSNERHIWGQYMQGLSPTEKGEDLKRARIEKAKVADEIMEIIRGLDLEYVIPKIVNLPLLHTEVNLFQIIKPFKKTKEFLFPSTKEKETLNIPENLTWEQLREYF